MDEVFIRSFNVTRYVFLKAVPVLFVTIYLQERGFFNLFTRLSSKIVRHTGFSRITGDAFVANFGSSYAGGGLLVEAYRKKKISRLNLICSAIFCSFPAYLRVSVVSTIPVAFSLLTFPLACFYAVFSFIVSAVKIIIVGTASLFLFDKNQMSAISLNEVINPKKKKTTEGSPGKRALKRTCKLALRILILVFVSTTFVFYLGKAGLLEKIPISASVIDLPDTLNPAIFTYIAHPYAGMGVIKDYSSRDLITTIGAMKLLLFCMLFSRPITALKEAPSYYFGIYGIANGTLIIFFNLAVFFMLSITGITLLSILF